MKIDWLIQKDGENTIGRKIEEAYNRKPTNVYMFIGNIRESGLSILEEGYVDTKAKVQIIFGFDKKNTTKAMLESMLRCTKEVYGYDNNKAVGLEGNIIVFKYKECASVFTFSGNTSENGIKDNMSIYTHIIYDFAHEQDKEEYKKIESILKNLIKEEETFIKINKTKIQELSAEKAIFSQKIYSYNVKTVAELLEESKKNRNVSSNEEKIEKVVETKLEDIKFDDLDEADFDIDIAEDVVPEVDLGDMDEETEEIEIPEEEYASEYIEETEENDNTDEEEEEDQEDYSGEAIDIESMIFEKPSIKIGRDTLKKIKEEKEKEDKDDTEEDEAENFDEEEIQRISKKINLKNVSTLVMQLQKQAKRGKEKEQIKIPNYVKELIPNFIDMSDAKTITEDGEKIKEKEIEMNIVNIEDNVSYEDPKAKILHKAGQTYIAFTSSMIGNVEIEENSIARILKLSDSKYSIEIIPVDSSEYTIWKKVCNLTFRGSSRKYGVM